MNKIGKVPAAIGTLVALGAGVGAALTLTHTDTVSDPNLSFVGVRTLKGCSQTATPASIKVGSGLKIVNGGTYPMVIRSDKFPVPGWTMGPQSWIIVRGNGALVGHFVASRAACQPGTGDKLTVTVH